MPRLKVDRERILRTLTFWLRPDFVLRVVNRFQRIAGFDRSIALASSALTALMPLLIFTSALLPALGDDDAADEIIDRYDLSGESAEAVKEVFSPDASVETSIGILGALFLLLAVLSFTRTIQRLFETTWELPPLSVRNSLNGLKWIGALLIYSAVTGALRGLFDSGALEIAAAVVLIPLAAAFLIWSGYILSAKRIPWRDLPAFGIVASGLLALYWIAATIYVPRLLETYAARYGVLGVVFAIISALFAGMIVIVGSAALGREVHDELGRIRRGERRARTRSESNGMPSSPRGGRAGPGAREWLDQQARGAAQRDGVANRPDARPGSRRAARAARLGARARRRSRSWRSRASYARGRRAVSCARSSSSAWAACSGW